MVIGSRQEFYQNLTYNTHSRFFLTGDGQSVKFPDHLSADAVELPESNVFGAYETNAALLPFAVQGVGGAFDGLVGAHTVEAFHKYVSEHCAERQSGGQLGGDLKSGVFFQPA